MLILASQRAAVARVTITVAEEVADYLNNRKRSELVRLEQEGHMTVQIVGAEGAAPEHLVVECRDADGREVKTP
jgi:Ribonuclease G/E